MNPQSDSIWLNSEGHQIPKIAVHVKNIVNVYLGRRVGPLCFRRVISTFVSEHKIAINEKQSPTDFLANNFAQLQNTSLDTLNKNYIR